MFGVTPEPASEMTGIAKNRGIEVAPPRMDAVRYALNELRSQIAGLRNEIERLSCI